MRFFLIFLAVFAINGCTTLKPVELPPERLHAMIVSGEIIQAGDRVKIVTADGTRHELRVTEVTEEKVVGKDTDILIADIIAVETREFSGGKTAALAGGAVLVYTAIAVVVAFGSIATF